jgi:hypothetical protein
MMDEFREKSTQFRKTQGPVAFRNLHDAVKAQMDDINQRLNAGLAISQTPTAFEVHASQKDGTLLRVSLTGESNLHYSQLVKRHNEMQSGVIYIRISPDGNPAILFSDFPRPNVQVSYQDASKRLLNAAF